MKHYLSALCCLLVVSCSTLRSSSSRVEVTSVPSGAQVSSFYGKVLGVTPLKFTPEMVSNSTYKNKLFLLVRAPVFIANAQKWFLICHFRTGYRR